MSPRKIITLPTLLLQEAVHCLPGIGPKLNPRLDYWNRLAFDRLSARYVKNSEIVVSWAGSAKHSMHSAKRIGAKAILECGSAHAAYVREVLELEYERLGVPPKERECAATYRDSVDRELEEYEMADYLAIPSGFVRQTFLQKGIAEEKLLRVPYGTDTAMFHPAARQDGKFRALYVGMVWALKGARTLLEAWREFAPSRGMELLLVGRVAPNMKRLIQEGRRGVRFAGKVEHNQLPHVYSNASVFVFPSLADGWSFALGEAMACGLPVVCTTTSGAAEFVRDGVEGFVVPPCDPCAIAEKLDYFRNNESRRKEMGEAARARACQFSWDHYGERIWETYSNLS